MNAIIIGGGVGGLCAAIALRRVGIDTHVYERADMLGDVGAGLVIWANAIRALRELDLADAVIAAGAKIQRGQIRASDGSILAESRPDELEKTFGEPTIAIHRAALHKILLAALPAENIHLGVSCSGVEQTPDSATARLSDGSEARGDFLVGADGVRSAIRRQLFPEIQLRYSGYTAWRGAVISRDEVALGITSESWGRGNRFGVVRMDAERIYWFATANAPQGVAYPPAERKELLLKIFGDWAHPARHLIEATPAEDILHNDISDIKPMKRWGVGRVTLLGDAAHATTPNMGQGACMAIESAATLAQCVKNAADVPAALREYETRRQPRAAWITNQSWQIGRVGQWENPLACAARNFMVKLSAGAMKAQLNKAVGYIP